MGQDNMKKILYFITTSNWGGASQYVYDLCKYEMKKGNKVYLAVGSEGELSKKVEELGCKVYIVNSVKRNIDPINDVRSIFAIRKLVKKVEPDIVHLHSSKAGVIGRIACCNLNSHIKVIFTVHGWAFTDGIPSETKKRIYRMAEKVVSPLTTLFICVSYFDKRIGLRDKVLSKNSNVIVIHNGAPEPPKGFVAHSIHKPIRLVMTARFSNQKDQMSLIRAVKNLPTDQYQLSFVGDGPNLAECKRLADGLGLTSNIKFVGFQRNVRAFLEENDIYVLTSHYEGLPLSIIEAMSFRMPVIASDVGGNKELIKNKENGFLVHNVEELTKSLLFFINNPNEIKKMGEKSFSLYKNDYKLEDRLEEIDRAYNDLLRKKKKESYENSAGFNVNL